MDGNYAEVIQELQSALDQQRAHYKGKIAALKQRMGNQSSEMNELRNRLKGLEAEVSGKIQLEKLLKESKTREKDMHTSNQKIQKELDAATNYLIELESNLQ